MEGGAVDIGRHWALDELGGFDKREVKRTDPYDAWDDMGAFRITRIATETIPSTAGGGRGKSSRVQCGFGIV